MRVTSMISSLPAPLVGGSIVNPKSPSASVYSVAAPGTSAALATITDVPWLTNGKVVVVTGGSVLVVDGGVDGGVDGVAVMGGSGEGVDAGSVEDDAVADGGVDVASERDGTVGESSEQAVTSNVASSADVASAVLTRSGRVRRGWPGMLAILPSCRTRCAASRRRRASLHFGA